MRYLILSIAMLLAFMTQSKTLVVYYSYTGNCEEIVNSLTQQITADVLEIEPAEKGLQYEANNYALGSALLNAIKANPDDAESYPAIDPVNVSLNDYATVIIVTPLWWSQMAAIMQTYLFQYGPQMANKNIGLIVSSHSSGISGVVADCQRLVPDGNYFSVNLWINAANHSNRDTLIKNWLTAVDYDSLTTDPAKGDLNDDELVDVTDLSLLIDRVLGKNNIDFNKADLSEDGNIDVTDVSMLINIVLGTEQTMTPTLYITIGSVTKTATLVNNSSTEALMSQLQQGDITYEAHDYGGFEKVGALGYTFPQNNEQITTEPGDLILYLGNSLCIYYDTNSWNFTRIGKLNNMTQSEIKSFVNADGGNVIISLSSRR